MILNSVVSIGGSEDLVRYVRSFLAGNCTTIETSYGKTGGVELLHGIKQGPLICHSLHYCDKRYSQVGRHCCSGSVPWSGTRLSASLPVQHLWMCW